MEFELDPELKENMIFKAARFYYRLNSALFLIAIFSPVILKPIFQDLGLLGDFIVIVPAITLFFLIPVGFRYSLKAYRRLRRTPVVRRYFFVHVFYISLIILMLAAVIVDINQHILN